MQKPNKALKKAVERYKKSSLNILDKYYEEFERLNKGNDSIDDDFNFAFKRVFVASKKDVRKSLVGRLAKLSEEVGELAAEILIDDGYSQKKRKKGEVEQNIKEEAVHCLLMVLDIFNFVGADRTTINYLVHLKCTKWEKTIEKKKRKALLARKKRELLKNKTNE